MLLNCKL